MLIDTRTAFVDALRHGLLLAAEAGVSAIWMSDVDFADWPLNEVLVIDALMRWAAPQRRLLLLMQNDDMLRQRHPRFVSWRRTWGHVVDARVPHDCEAADHPTVLLVGELQIVQLHDREHWRGKVSALPIDRVQGKERLDAISQRSSPTFAATTLGL